MRSLIAQRRVIASGFDSSGKLLLDGVMQAHDYPINDVVRWLIGEGLCNVP